MRTLLLFATTALCFAQYHPPSQLDRLKWATFASVGPPNLAAGVFTSAISTWQNDPPEYGPHWQRYGKRQLLRVGGSLTSNFMEAELGMLWGEDPRYRRSGKGPIKKRAFYAIKTAFLAYDRNGKAMPAYARYASISGSNVLGNTWRPDSQRTASETGSRIALGFVGRIVSNAFAEFWPDIRDRINRP
jgi:hypothetical protein